jgi:YegS/Rv2252/BmrU family lipid kinase
MKHIFIINPVAGKGNQQKKIMDDIERELKGRDVEYEIYVTQYKGDAERFVKEKCGEKTPAVFYSCGGDGTLHEVLNAAVGYEHACVGVIPCGSGNDFVKNFNNDGNFLNIAAQVEGSSEKIDLIKFGENYAASVCNIGFDADAALNMHKFKKIPFISGTACYLLSVFYCLLNKFGVYLDVELDGEKFSGLFILGVIANGHSYGGGYKCAPLAVINDGLMDICFVNKISRARIIGLLGIYKAGKHLEDPKISKYITYRKCRSVKVKGKGPINLCFDGENMMADGLEFKIEREALKFWLPKGTSPQTEKIAKLASI